MHKIIMNNIKKTLKDIKKKGVKNFIEENYKRVHNDFKYYYFYKKFLLIFILFLTLDFTISTIKYLENNHKYVDFNKNFQNKKYDIYKNLLTDEHRLNLINIDKLKKISKIDKIIFQYENPYTIRGIVKVKDNVILPTTKMPVMSFVMNVEPKLIKDNINYEWDKFHKIDKYFLQKPKEFHLIILPYVSKHILTILFILVIIYLVSMQTGGLFTKKYNIVRPEDITDDLNDLVGINNIKEEILQLKDIIQNMSKYKSIGINKTFNIMFSGPAGTGKTKVASSLAKELNVPMIIGTGNVETGFVNGGASIIKEIFNNGKIEAFNNPSKTAIIFLDEAQILLAKRGVKNSQSSKWDDDTANELLAQLDGVNTTNDVNLIFIAASNFDEGNMEIDEAMERRFKKKIYFNLPIKEEREELLNLLLSKIDLSYKESNIDTKYLSEITAKLSFAKIETIVEEASLLAIRKNEKISTKLLTEAFQRIVVGETDRKLTNKNEKARKTIIYHELGHFFTQFDNIKNEISNSPSDKLDSDIIQKIKEEMNFLKISTESIAKYNALGFVLSSEDNVLLKTKKDYENDIVSLYGGVAAEVHFLNNDNNNTDNITSGSFNDIEKISKILYKMVYELGMYSNRKINMTILKIDNDENNKNLIDVKSEELFQKSLSIVKDYENIIEYFYHILEKEWTLDKGQMFYYINEYYKNVS